MKKTIFCLAAGAMALTACTSTDVIEEGIQSNAIGFQTVVGKQSRATDLTKANLNNFQVYSYYTITGKEGNPVSVFDGEAVTLKDGAWSYTNTRYWVPGATYYFYAYSCGNQKMTSNNGVPAINTTNAGVMTQGFTLSDFSCNSTHQHDLIFATNEGYIAKEAAAENQPAANSKVGFTFKHILTKVNAEFTSEFAPGYDIEVSNVQISNIRDNGDFNSTKEEGQEWTATRSANDMFVNLGLTEPNNVASNAETADQIKKAITDAAYVIPHEYTESEVKLTFNIKVKQGNDTFLDRNLTGTWKPNWKMGYSYTYKIAITGTTANLEPIVFETAENMNVEGFEEGSAPEINFSAN